MLRIFTSISNPGTKIKIIIIKISSVFSQLQPLRNKTSLSPTLRAFCAGRGEQNSRVNLEGRFVQHWKEAGTSCIQLCLLSLNVVRMLHLGMYAVCRECMQIPSLPPRNISLFRFNPSQNLDREAPKWDHSAWKMEACCCHPVENGRPQLLGTTLEVHKATAGTEVEEICEAVITLMRPRGKETREFPLQNLQGRCLDALQE